MASIVDERGFNQGFKLTFAQRVRLRRRAEAIVHELRLPANRSDLGQVHVLELGCGTGELAAELAQLTNAAVTGVDLSPQFIAKAAAAHRIRGLQFMVADLTKPPPELERRRYDYIVGNGILHHLFHQLGPALTMAKEWLRPGGKIVFWEPNIANPYVYLIFSYPSLRKLARLEPDEMAFSGRYIKALLQRVGYHNVRVDPRDFLLPNIPAPLVGTVAKIGDVVERFPVVRLAAQSLFIRAEANPF